MDDQLFDTWLLSLRTDHKLNLIRDALLEQKFGIYMQLVDTFMKATISDGGIGTDTLRWAFGPDYMDPNFQTNGKRFNFSESQDSRQQA